MAAGVLLPITNTMLTPSLAGALMGISSLGVMANSLLLQSEYNRRNMVPGHHNKVKKTTHSAKTLKDSVSEVDVEKGSPLSQTNSSSCLTFKQ